MTRQYTRRVPLGPRGPRGGYRRRKLRAGELRVIAALRKRSYPTTYQLAKELNAFGVFKVVRNFIRMGLVARTAEGLRITDKISLFETGDPFWVPENATQRVTRIGESLAPILPSAPKPAPQVITFNELKTAYEAEQTSRRPSFAIDQLRLQAAREAEAAADRSREQRRSLAAKVPAPVADLTREQHRSRRAREVRGRTINVKRMTKRELETGRLLYPEKITGRPKTRAECIDAPRPCPYIGCRYHLFLDVSPKSGAIKLNFPDLEPDELSESCTLDVADRDGETLEVVGRHLNVTRERLRQIEERALIQLRSFPVHEFDEDGEARTPTRSHQSRVA